MNDFRSRLLAEGLGTAGLLAAVVGSGIMGQRLAGGNDAIALLANSLATGVTLTCLILALGPISGAHFNPAVTVVAAAGGELTWREAGGYLGAQVVGGALGVVVANLMFDLGPVTLSTQVRTGPNLWLGEFVATTGLLAVILLVARHRATAMPAAVGCYITGAYWFTSSTSFANPAVTLARALTDTFAGIRPADVAGFVAAQAAAVAIVILVRRGLRVR